MTRPVLDQISSPRMDAAPAIGLAEAPDDESRSWLERLRADGPAREIAIADLHDLLSRAARREAERRRGSLPPHVVAELAELAEQAANDAVVAVMRKLDSYRGGSRFTTWSYKFAVFEVSTTLRRAAWRDRTITVDDAAWERIVDDGAPDPHVVAELRELVLDIRRSVTTDLTRRQRDVFAAVVVGGVPIDVLAERYGTTRGAIYKTLHDARARIRAQMRALGWPMPGGTR